MTGTTCLVSSVLQGVPAESLSQRGGSRSRWQRRAGMQHHRRSSPAAGAAQHPPARDVDIKYLSGLFLLCLSFVGETKRQLAGSTETFRLKCPQKLAGRLCLLNTVLRLTMPSAAPLPWGSAGSAPNELLAALFWKNRKFYYHASRCFQKMCTNKQDCPFNKDPQVIIINC